MKSSTKKNLPIFFVLIVLVGAGIYYWREKIIPSVKAPVIYTPEGGNNNQEEKQDSVVITYTDYGFSPSVVNVKKGGKVIFKNESSKMMLVYSAPYPSHTDYPELNAKEIVEKDGSYSFVFEKRGAWGFYNYFSPNDTGKVVVE